MEGNFDKSIVTSIYQQLNSGDNKFYLHTIHKQLVQMSHILLSINHEFSQGGQLFFDDDDWNAYIVADEVIAATTTITSSYLLGSATKASLLQISRGITRMKQLVYAPPDDLLLLKQRNNIIIKINDYFKTLDQRHIKYASKSKSLKFTRAKEHYDQAAKRLDNINQHPNAQNMHIIEKWARLNLCVYCNSIKYQRGPPEVQEIGKQLFDKPNWQYRTDSINFTFCGPTKLSMQQFSSLFGESAVGFKRIDQFIRQRYKILKPTLLAVNHIFFDNETKFKFMDGRTKVRELDVEYTTSSFAYNIMEYVKFKQCKCEEYNAAGLLKQSLSKQEIPPLNIKQSMNEEDESSNSEQQEELKAIEPETETKQPPMKQLSKSSECCQSSANEVLLIHFQVLQELTFLNLFPNPCTHYKHTDITAIIINHATTTICFVKSSSLGIHF